MIWSSAENTWDRGGSSVHVPGIIRLLGTLTFLGCGISPCTQSLWCASLTSILIALIMVQAEYKTKWAAPLTDLPGYFRQRNPSVLVRQSIDAVYRLYGYMTFNDNKYGVLSKVEYAWFFKRVERGRTMKYYGPIGVDPASSPSMLKAFVGIILLAENAWFVSSPTVTPANPLQVDTSVHLTQPPVNVKWPSGTHIIIVRKSWPDHTKPCHSILSFVFSTVAPYVMPQPRALH